ncbi:MAG: hypothetical protein IJO94_07405, partial [Firmicutes bacterium]|nr:hypothetical protein [Bacillota bacterium]
LFCRFAAAFPLGSHLICPYRGTFPVRGRLGEMLLLGIKNGRPMVAPTAILPATPCRGAH